MIAPYFSFGVRGNFLFALKCQQPVMRPRKQGVWHCDILSRISGRILLPD